MPTILASEIITECRTILHDSDGVRWPELITYLNDGQRFVVLLKPSANVKNATVKLVAGTKQAIPADGVQLIDIPRNMGVNGNTIGRAIRITDKNQLDRQLPDWHKSKADSIVKNYTYSSEEPKTFYVFPPQPATNQGYVDMVYGALPVNVTASETIKIDDIYKDALINYILHRAYSKDSEFSADVSRSDKHLQLAISMITGKSASEKAFDPNNTQPPTL